MPRRTDGTVDTEPANLTRMCILKASDVHLPYRQNKKTARYHLYAKETVHLPARTAVTVELGYRVNLSKGLTIHTCRAERQTHCG